VVSVKSADQKKEFNFFANFVPSFPENAGEPCASGPEIKFLVSRKTSEKRVLFSYDFHATAPDCGATSVGSTLNEWWVWETEGTLKVFGEMQKITRSLKNRSGEFPETAARPATPAPPPVQTHRDNRPVVDEGRVRNNRPPSPVDLQKVTSMNGYTGWINADYIAPER
jgi:hypothetical protein